MRVGFVGWRGMVGSVLMRRMKDEGDFDGLDASFFSTSNPGGDGPLGAPLLDARDTSALRQLDAVVSCQGGDYTAATHPALRAAGWQGHWIDAASALRMNPDATLVLDPVNDAAIRRALAAGCTDFVGPNCTVSLLLMALNGLIASGHVEWISTMTYQAASGAGANNLRELVDQMAHASNGITDPAQSALEIDAAVAARLSDPAFPVAHFGAPLAASAIPWIDRRMDDGQTREEWKAMAEANKLLGRADRPLPIDGVCVRIGSMRSHAQAVTIKLNAEVPLDEVESMIHENHAWTSVIPNTAPDTLRSLTPAAVAGTLQVPVGRLRRMKLGPTFFSAFTVGDQLLWGAAEPLRRMLNILRE